MSNNKNKSNNNYDNGFDKLELYLSEAKEVYNNDRKNAANIDTKASAFIAGGLVLLSLFIQVFPFEDLKDHFNPNCIVFLDVFIIILCLLSLLALVLFVYSYSLFYKAFSVYKLAGFAPNNLQLYEEKGLTKFEAAQDMIGIYIDAYNENIAVSELKASYLKKGQKYFIASSLSLYVLIIILCIIV